MKSRSHVPPRRLTQTAFLLTFLAAVAACTAVPEGAPVSGAGDIAPAAAASASADASVKDASRDADARADADAGPPACTLSCVNDAMLQGNPHCPSATPICHVMVRFQNEDEEFIDGDTCPIAGNGPFQGKCQVDDRDPAARFSAAPTSL